MTCVSSRVSSVPLGVIKWVCELIHTHTIPWGRLKWPYAITRLTAHFMCGLMSDIWWFASLEKVWSYLALNTLSETRCQNNTNQTHTHSNNCFVYIFRRSWTKWLYWEARHSVKRIAKYTAAPFSNVKHNANEVWMFWITQALLQK